MRLFGDSQPAGEVAVVVPGVFPKLGSLLPRQPTEVTGFSKLPGHSGIQLQVADVLLDPGLPGVSTDLPASFGLEAVERHGRITC